jgi:xanthine dehydrogenase accessory factor
MTDAELYAAIARWAAAGEVFVVATVVDTHGSAPQKAGAKLAVRAGGELVGTIGGGAIEKQVVETARELIAQREASRLLKTHLTHDLGMCCGGAMTVFLERHDPGPRLVLFGAGHVHRAAAEVGAQVGFRVLVIDEREEWLTELRFPRAERLLEDPAIAAGRLALEPRDFCCVATHDHALDERVVKALAPRPLAYLGMIGSERKGLRVRERLAQQGVAEAAIDRVQTPMGLDIGAQTPEEIAVAMVAELIRVRRRAPTGAVQAPT